MNSVSKLSVTRWQAAIAHLGATLAFAGICFGTLFWLWYSPGLWGLAGIPRALWILLTGAILAGPLMTMAAYRPGKPGLRTDMAIIIAIQLVFLAFAVFTFGRNRPVFLVAAVDRFELVRAAELAPEDLATAKAQYRRLSWTGPQIVGIELPQDNDERFDLILSGLSGKDVQLLPRLYTRYQASAQALADRALPLTPLIERDTKARQLIETALSRAGRTSAGITFVPIRGPNYSAAIMLMDSNTGEVVRRVDVDPWKEGSASTK